MTDKLSIRKTKIYDTFEEMCREHLAVYYRAEQIIKERETICLLPRWCRISGKFLWFRRSTKLTRKFTGISVGGNPFKEKMWVDSKQLTLFKLRDLGK